MKFDKHLLICIVLFCIYTLTLIITKSVVRLSEYIASHAAEVTCDGRLFQKSALKTGNVAASTVSYSSTFAGYKLTL